MSRPICVEFKVSLWRFLPTNQPWFPLNLFRKRHGRTRVEFKDPFSDGGDNTIRFKVIGRVKFFVPLQPNIPKNKAKNCAPRNGNSRTHNATHTIIFNPLEKGTIGADRSLRKEGTPNIQKERAISTKMVTRFYSNKTHGAHIRINDIQSRKKFKSFEAFMT
ncbi:hypothetical protein SLA2020_494740 [Shorea laevis]